MKIILTVDRAGKKDADYRVVDNEFVPYRHKADVETEEPTAQHIIAVAGGYAVFATHDDYEQWQRQS